MGLDIDDYTSSDKYPMNGTVAAIQQGWIGSNSQVASTENYLGRVPVESDVALKPRFPVLPNLKKTRKRYVVRSAVRRHAFGMPAGGGRNVSLKLPGKVFNPVNIPTNTPSVVPICLDTGFVQPCMDSHTYCVTIAVNGARATLGLSQNSPNAFARVGDGYCEANVQFYCSYEEKVGPCIYQPPASKILYNHGGIVPVGSFSTPPTGFTKNTITMLNQSQQVRLNPTQPNEASNAGV